MVERAYGVERAIVKNYVYHRLKPSPQGAQRNADHSWIDRQAPHHSRAGRL
jgi:hypothetical protein